MKLRELMDNAFDETWIVAKTPDGEEHAFWVADYIGGHKPTMEELNPLLDCEFEDFSLIVRRDPEAEDAKRARRLPMVYVELESLQTNAETESENG